MPQNSDTGGLSTAQLRLATAGLARSAAAADARGVLLLYCADAVVNAAQRKRDDAPGRLRAALALVALVPALPQGLLPRVLDALLGIARDMRAEALVLPDNPDAVQQSATAAPEAEDKARGAQALRILAHAVYEEISERAGDAERAYLVGWWLAHGSVFEP